MTLLAGRRPRPIVRGRKSAVRSCPGIRSGTTLALTAPGRRRCGQPGSRRGPASGPRESKGIKGQRGLVRGPRPQPLEQESRRGERFLRWSEVRCWRSRRQPCSGVDEQLESLAMSSGKSQCQFLDNDPASACHLRASPGEMTRGRSFWSQPTALTCRRHQTGTAGAFIQDCRAHCDREGTVGARPPKPTAPFRGHEPRKVIRSGTLRIATCRCDTLTRLSLATTVHPSVVRPPRLADSWP